MHHFVASLVRARYHAFSVFTRYSQHRIYNTAAVCCVLHVTPFFLAVIQHIIHTWYTTHAREHHPGEAYVRVVQNTDYYYTGTINIDHGHVRTTAITVVRVVLTYS